jgi:hypothetical protein
MMSNANKFEPDVQLFDGIFHAIIPENTLPAFFPFAYPEINVKL